MVVKRQRSWLDLALDILSWVFLLELVRYLLGYPKDKSWQAWGTAKSEEEWANGNPYHGTVGALKGILEDYPDYTYTNVISVTPLGQWQAGTDKHRKGPRTAWVTINMDRRWFR